MRHPCRATLAIVGALMLSFLATTTSAAVEDTSTDEPASAAYRYWGYYQWTDGAWAFATAGPADTVPEDGSLEGWRFAVTDESSSRFPRTDDVFGEICADDPTEAGNKQVAVVVDYGTTQDAPDGEDPAEPRGECAEVPTDASGADVLAAVAEVRLDDSGLSCGLDGYPVTGCGEQVSGAAPTGAEEPVELALPGVDAGTDERDEEPNEPANTEQTAAGEDAEDDSLGAGVWAIVVAVAMIVLLGTVALVRSRRSRPE